MPVLFETSTVANGAGNLTPAIPSGTTAGNLLLAVVMRDDNAAAYGTPSGWSLRLGPTNAGDGDVGIYVFAKIAASGETAPTFTSTTTRSNAALLMRFSGNNTTSVDAALDVEAIQAAANGTSFAIPATTPTVANTLVVAGVAIDASAAQTPNWTPPSGFTERIDAQQPTSFINYSVADLQQTTAAAVSGNFTSVQTDTAVTWLVAIVPAPVQTGNTTLTFNDTTGLVDSRSVVGPRTLPGAISDPVTLVPVEPEAMSHNPVWCDGNGNLYKAMESEPGINPVMMKSENKGQDWAEAGGATRPTDMDDVEGFWSWQVGTTIWVAQTQGGAADVHFRIYNTSDAASNPDTWVGTTETIGLAGSGSGAAQWVSFNRLSNGDAWFYFQNAAYRKRLANGTLGTQVATSVGQYPMPVTAASDLTYIFYVDSAAGQVLYRTLSSAGTLSAGTRVDTTGRLAGSTIYGSHSNAVYFDNGGVETVCCMYAEANGTPWLATVANGVLSRQQISTAAVSADQGTATGGGPDMHLAVDGTTVHMIWAESGTGDIFYRTRASDGTLSATQTLWTSGTDEAWYTYNHIFTSGGAKVMGYTYDRGPHANSASRVMYNEVAIAATGTAHTRTATDSAGVTDSSDVAEQRAVSGDSAGLTDSATVALVASPTVTPTDGAGLTDSISAVSVKQSASADSTGLTDTAVLVRALAAEHTHPAGLTDSIQTTRSVVLNFTDGAGLLDTSAASATGSGSFTDSAGLADGVVFTRSTVQAPTDGVGLADSSIISAGKAAAYTDSAGLTDSTQAERSAGHTDGAGLADSISTQSNKLLDFTDGAGLADISSSSVTSAGAVTPSDTAGLSDSISVARAATSADGVGLTDDVVLGTGRQPAFTDGAGLADNTMQALGRASAHTDGAGLSDSISTQAAWVAAHTSAAGLSDSFSLSLTAAGATTDSTGLTDSFDLQANRAPAHTDSVGMTDSTSRDLARQLAVTFTDAAGSTDAVARAASQGREHADVAGMTDSAEVVKSSASGATVAEDVGLADSTMVNRGTTVGEDAGLTDSVTLLLNSARTVVDNAALTDAVALLMESARAVVDDAHLTDTVLVRLIPLYVVAVDPQGTMRPNNAAGRITPNRVEAEFR